MIRNIVLVIKTQIINRKSSFKRRKINLNLVMRMNNNIVEKPIKIRKQNSKNIMLKEMIVEMIIENNNMIIGKTMNMLIRVIMLEMSRNEKNQKYYKRQLIEMVVMLVKHNLMWNMSKNRNNRKILKKMINNNKNPKRINKIQKD